MSKPREFHCIPSQGGDDTGFCVEKSDHGAIKGLAIHVIEKSAADKLAEALIEIKQLTLGMHRAATARQRLDKIFGTADNALQVYEPKAEYRGENE